MVSRWDVDVQSRPVLAPQSLRMQRQTRIVLWLAGALLFCLPGWVGFWLQLMNDYGKGVIWETEDGGLWM